MTSATGPRAPLPARLRTYQAERFPLAAYLPLMAVGTLAAMGFSRVARLGPVRPDSFPWDRWAVGALTLTVTFFFLRVLDEHKDAPDDARFRPELPVPRGLVTLRELRGVALALMAGAIALNALIDPALLVVLAVVLAWAGFMGREFFVRDWLRARPVWYLLSHMVIMPLIFFYATSLDWLVAGAGPPPGTGPFLVLAFGNGLGIEIGRKIRTPDEEREGVDTYSAVWGLNVAVVAWAAAVLVAGLAGVITVAAFSDALWPAALLALAVTGVLIRPFMNRIGQDPGGLRWVEPGSGAWVLASYAIIAAAAFFGGAA